MKVSVLATFIIPFDNIMMMKSPQKFTEDRLVS